MSMFEAFRILGRHSGLIQWANTRLPEGQQAISEIRGMVTKHKPTVDALVPLIPKLKELLKEVKDKPTAAAIVPLITKVQDLMDDASKFIKKHEYGLKELEDATPEFQQMVDELLPTLQQARQFAATNPEGNQNA